MLDVVFGQRVPHRGQLGPGVVVRLDADVGRPTQQDHRGRNAAAESPSKPRVEAARHERLVRVIHRPGSVQTEFRIGHVGVPRLIPDFHALSVMSSILGGLFNSRLNRKLREEKGAMSSVD